MSEQQTGIDVLAVMQASADQLWRYRRDILAREEEQARAAVAELLAAVRDVYGAMDGESCSSPCPSCRVYAALAAFAETHE